MRLLFILSLALICTLTVLWYISEPQVVYYEPTNNITDNSTNIKIKYKNTIQPESLIKNLEITPPIQFSWEYDNNTIIITPNENLPRNQTYNIRINSGVLPSIGKASTVVQEWSFTVDAAEHINITLLGDILLDKLPSDFKKSNNPYYSYEMLPENLLTPQDLVIGNLECPISNKGKEIENKAYRFRASIDAVNILKAGNIDVVSVANNHSLDYGPQALADTILHCQNANITTVGYGEKGANSVKPIIIEHEGYTIGIAAYVDKSIIPAIHHDLWEGKGENPGIRYIDNSIFDEISLLSKEVDIVVVAMHWGLERQHTVTNQQREIAQRLIDSGANIIMGHHAHVAQGIERYKEGVIFYSLGNFIFPPTNEYRRSTFVPTIKLNAKSILNIDIYPIKPVNGRPHAMSKIETHEFYNKLQAWGLKLGTSISKENNLTYIRD